MPNITIHLDEDTHRLAKIHAAKTGTSLSQSFRDHIRTIAGSAQENQRTLVLEKFCAGEISRPDAMQLLGFHCIEDLYATAISAGHDLPRQQRKDALASGNAALKFIEECTRG
jgi:hypothetical protein